MCLGLCLTSWGGQSQLSVFTIPDWVDVWTAGVTPLQINLTELTAKNSRRSLAQTHTCLFEIQLVNRWLPIIIGVVPVVKMNEQSIVDHGGNGGHADQRRVLSVHCLQFHPGSESRRSHRLERRKTKRC